jgi:hypothetical protein
VAAGYHGEVALDQDTSRVLRLTAEADDIPKETGITASSVQVDYDFVDVAGAKRLLPSHSDSRMEHGDSQTRQRGDVHGVSQIRSGFVDRFRQAVGQGTAASYCSAGIQVAIFSMASGAKVSASRCQFADN